jgi:hypothetical protein
MPEHWLRPEQRPFAEAFFWACIVLGAVACAAWAVWFVTPHGPPPPPGELRCGTGYAIVLPFALLFGGVVGAVGGMMAGSVLVIALCVGNWLWRR